MSPRFADVVLPLPLADSYTYRIPDELAARIVPGARAVVPVRRRTVTGIVSAVDVQAPAVAARDILRAPDDEPSVTPPLLELARWMSGYYGAPLGLAVKLLLPTALWGTDTGAGERTERVLVLSAERLTLVERDERFRRRPRQRALYETVEALGGSAPVRHLMEQLGFGDGLIRALAREGVATIEQNELLRDPFSGVRGTPPPPGATPAQAAALDRLAALEPGRGALLLGVTGSGKTMVYLEAVRRELGRGRGAIVLVPEIGLTPQTVSRFRGAFGDQVAVLHSALSDGERADAWRLLRRGERRVAVGARSAILAPVADLGL
ncbi:MAG TPA: DEAD/DEAH box helicase, partial [Gemmatimonadales bacterium]